MAKVFVKPVDKKDLKLFKLVNGVHVGLDYTAEPTAVTDADGKVTGYMYPSKQFDSSTADNYVWDTVDLVKKCVNKFQAEPDWSDAHKRVSRGEKFRDNSVPRQPLRGDEMDRIDAELSAHNPPQDAPDVADKTKLPQHAKESVKSKTESAEVSSKTHTTKKGH